MTLRSAVARLLQREQINFVLTNRVPRRQLTRFMGWFSKIEHPWICRASIAIWRMFTDLELRDAKHSRFRSLHECFTRELRDGARPVCEDPRVLVSPCDAIVGATGRITRGAVLQAKGRPYPLAELLGEAGGHGGGGDLVPYYANGWYTTLRLTSGMYHRFHAPADCRVERVTYLSGDTWNVNPSALRRVERLFCRNERATLQCRLIPSGYVITLVPIAAILVASIRLNFLDLRLHLKYDGPEVIPCDSTLQKGQEMGCFEHGSTMIVFAPPELSLSEAVSEGHRLLVGQPLFRLPTTAAHRVGITSTPSLRATK
jgi:phosphatidylserine decarboxylase